MDVFAFPSYTDTFGNVILEAMASGVPAVVTTGGGPKYLVRSGETGFIAADDNSFIRSVMNLMNDTVLHRGMCVAAREYACSVSWERVFDSVYNVYFETLFRDESFRAAS
jgi:glycosyltransferase involved in cell wall biosynthesis